MLNEYQLLARRSMVEATRGDGTAALADADRVKRLFSELNAWTHHYNEEIQQGKWSEFFNWQPYHWFRSDKIDPPFATAELVQQISQSPRPRFLCVSDAPYVDYDIDLQEGDRTIEVRTLPTLHVYEGRDIRYAVQLGDGEPHVFSIHANDFTAEWRWNVLRGYASRSISVPASMKGSQRLRIYFLDPGVTIQEICVHR
jgi:hypothetical protein